MSGNETTRGRADWSAQVYGSKRIGLCMHVGLRASVRTWLWVSEWMEGFVARCARARMGLCAHRSMCVRVKSLCESEDEDEAW